MHMDRPVFVFSSNLSGHHDEGAALEALRNRGAIYGNAQGSQGNSYAIPTLFPLRTKICARFLFSE